MSAAFQASSAGRRWSAGRPGGPSRLVPRPEATAGIESPPSPVPLVISGEVMAAALADGKAIPLTPIVISLVRYRDRWWLDAVDEWLQITDPVFAASLDARHSLSPDPPPWLV